MAEGTEDFSLHIDEGFFLYFFMDDFLVDCFDSEGVNFVHFGGDVHDSDSGDMELGERDIFLAFDEVPVEEFDRCKVSFIAKLVGLHDFNHPVKHPSPQEGSYLMIAQEGWFLRGLKLVLGYDVLPI